MKCIIGALLVTSRRRLLPLIAFGVLILGAQGVRAYALPSPPSATVALKVTSDGLVVPVQINGRSMSAVIDTGASATVIDKALAKELGVASVDDVSIGGGAKAVMGGEGEVVQLSLAGRKVSVRPLLIDLASVGLTERILVGRDFLDTTVTQLDFEKGLLRLMSESEVSGATDLGQRIELTKGTMGAMLAARVLLDGKPTEALIDLGSQTPLSVPESIGQDARSRRVSTWVRSDIAGLSIYQVTRIHSLDLAGTTLKNVPAIIEPQQLRGGQALLGLPVLERFKVTLDMGHGTAWLRPAQDTQAPFGHDRLGLAMVPDPEGLKVIHVAQSSPAETAGIKVGDVITRVDGELVGAGNAPALAKVGRGATGRHVALATRDGKSVNVIMADYF
jgi:predicted aspartyl protease